jgi:hemerythrin
MEILSSLVRYTQRHFSAEDKIIRESNFPDFAVLLTIHQKVTRQVLELMDKIKNGKIVPAVKITTVLKDWLINHTTEVNKQYVQYITHIDKAGAEK